jgi:hypothetical protein
VFGDALPELRLESLELSLTPDDRRPESLRTPSRRTPHRDEPERGNRVALALQCERLEGLDLNGVAHETVRRRPDQDLARTRRLLEPRCDVDGVPHEDQRLAASMVARHDLARVHPNAGL